MFMLKMKSDIRDVLSVHINHEQQVSAVLASRGMLGMRLVMNSYSSPQKCPS
jgi:acetylglutamate synthase